MIKKSLHGVRVDRNVRIPLSDGVTLAADLYLPDPRALSGPDTYYPYHKDGRNGARLITPAATLPKEAMQRQRGYARHRGSSGLRWELGDPNEGQDAAEAIEWIAAQDWSDGNVGMWGYPTGE